MVQIKLQNATSHGEVKFPSMENDLVGIGLWLKRIERKVKVLLFNGVNEKFYLKLLEWMGIQAQ